MQPPRTSRLSIGAEVRYLIEEANRRSQCSPQPPHPRCAIDYVKAMQQWFAGEPEALRHSRYSMTELVLQFSRRHRRQPAPRLVAQALRELGWTEHRDWTCAGRNRRYWRPPD